MGTLFDIIPDFFFRGNKYQCNICGFQSNGWLPRGHNYPIIKELEIIGAGKRWVDCKKCGSSDRDRLVFEFLKYKNQLNPLENLHFLHVAPEAALNKKIEYDFNCKSTKIDYKAPGYRFTYSKDVELGDIQQLNFPDESFDFILCNHVLEHVPDDEKAIKEIHRVLKPGGFGIIQVPISLKIDQTITALSTWNSHDKKMHLGQKDHLRLYGLDIRKLIEKHHLTMNEWYFNDQKLLSKLKINPEEFILNITKSIN